MCNWAPQGRRCGRLLVWVVQHVISTSDNRTPISFGDPLLPHRLHSQLWGWAQDSGLGTGCTPLPSHSLCSQSRGGAPWMLVACSLGEDRGETW